jgi:hypothetical protein
MRLAPARTREWRADGVAEAAASLHHLSCPFRLKSKDGEENGEICFDGPVLELRRTSPDGKK